MKAELQMTASHDARGASRLPGTLRHQNLSASIQSVRRALMKTLPLLFSTASAAHVFYSAIGGKDGPGIGYSDVSNSLVWGPWNDIGDVFASNEFFFENGQVGYMGGQQYAAQTRLFF